MRHRAPRDRIHAASRRRRRAAGWRPAEPAVSAPAITFADGIISAGRLADRRSTVRKGTRSNDRPMPEAARRASAYVPGNGYRIYQPGTATAHRRIDADFQMHWHHDGQPTTDRTNRPGLREGATENALVGAVSQRRAASVPATPTRASTPMTLNRDFVLWSILPHTHARQAVDLRGDVPGRTEANVAVSAELQLRLADRLHLQVTVKLPKGTVVHATAVYDNSPANKSNPDPTSGSLRGDRTFER